MCPWGRGSLRPSREDPNLGLLWVLGFASCYAASFASVSLSKFLKWVASESPQPTELWVALAHTVARAGYPTRNLVAFHSYQVFSFPCFINNTIKLSHMFINYLYPEIWAACRCLLIAFLKHLAFHFHVGNLLCVRDLEPLWVSGAASLSPQSIVLFLVGWVVCFILFNFFACYACADADMRT